MFNHHHNDEYGNCIQESDGSEQQNRAYYLEVVDVNKKIKLETTNDGNIAYLSLPEQPGIGSGAFVAKTINLHKIIDNYHGSEVLLDFDSRGVMIGIEMFIDYFTFWDS